MLNICLIAGETSGDVIGGDFLKSLNICTNVQAFGVGGESMQAQGMEILLQMNLFSLIGMDIVWNIYTLKKKVDYLVQEILKRNPDSVVTIDSPVLSLHIVRALRKAGYKNFAVHYVMPTIWAWRPDRLFSFSAVYDHMFALFPFEMKYAQSFRMACTYVGHPLFFQDWSNFQVPQYIDNQTRIAVFPGSRKQEIYRLLPIFCEAIHQLDIKNVLVVIPVLPHTKDYISSIIRNYNISYLLVGQKEKYPMVASCQVALLTSGTSMLEVGFLHVPMVLAYKVSYLSFFIGSLLVYTPFVGLINILARKMIVPERLQNEASPVVLKQDLQKLLGTRGQEQIQKVAKILKPLQITNEQSGMRAAKAFLLLQKNIAHK